MFSAKCLELKRRILYKYLLILCLKKVQLTHGLRSSLIQTFTWCRIFELQLGQVLSEQPKGSRWLPQDCWSLLDMDLFTNGVRFWKTLLTFSSFFAKAKMSDKTFAEYLGTYIRRNKTTAMISDFSNCYFGQNLTKHSDANDSSQEIYNFIRVEKQHNTHIHTHTHTHTHTMHKMSLIGRCSNIFFLKKHKLVN